MNLSQNRICPICTIDYEPGEKVAVLGCHTKHMFHENCFADYDKFFTEKN